MARTAFGAALFFGLWTLAVLGFSLWANAGHFIYALDDPYIHLDLADQLWRTGVYGVNPGVWAAPSSSILWPFLLAPFAGTPFFIAVPFIIGLVCTMGCGALLVRLGAQLGFRPRAAFLFALLGGMALNLPGLTMMGMEHTLHILLTLYITLRLLQLIQDARTPDKLLYTALLLSPLVRYEGFIISGAALAVLFLRGYRKQAVLCGVVILLPALAFSGYLLSHGLEALPSSTIAKRLRFGHVESSFWRFTMLNVASSLGNPASLLMVLTTFITPVLLYRARKSAPRAILLCALGVALWGHLFLGRYSALELPRYDLYVLAFAVPLLLRLYADKLRRPFGLLMLVLFLTPGTLASTTGAVMASRAIYLQQEQMRRLAQDYWHAPIAVHDIGLVGLHNPSMVLDLWGLADASIRKARFARQPHWAESAVRAHDIKLIAVYDSWVPAADRTTWTLLGTLHRTVHSDFGDDDVLFLTPDVNRAPELRAMLAAWGQTLPQGASYKAQE